MVAAARDSQVAEARHKIAAQAQLAPVARQTDRGAATKGETAADVFDVVGAGRSARTGIRFKCGFQPETGLQATAQIFTAAKAKTAGGIAVSRHQIVGAAATAGKVGIARVDNAKQRHARLRLRRRARQGQQHGTGSGRQRSPREYLMELHYLVSLVDC